LAAEPTDEDGGAVFRPSLSAKRMRQTSSVVRYSRALTGSQVSGDAYVGATLEALLKDPDLLHAPQPPRVTLYRLFSTIWNSLSVNDNAEPVTDVGAAERNLDQITAQPRQAFLLIAVGRLFRGACGPHS
jgi:hypothetical protein